MTNNKLITEQMSSAEVVKSSQASLPQMKVSTGKAPVPVTTVDTLKVGETATPPEANKDLYQVADIQATEPLTENSTLFDSFGPDAVNFVSIGMADMATKGPFSLKTTLKEAFGENVPYVLKILLQDQAAMKPQVIKANAKVATTPKVTKKIIVTKAGAQAIAQVKKMGTKSTLEEVFGADMAAKLINSVKTEAISQITKSTAVKPAPIKSPIPTNLLQPGAAKKVVAEIKSATPAAPASTAPRITNQPAVPAQQLIVKPTTKKLSNYVPVKPLNPDFKKPIPAPGKPGVFILPPKDINDSIIRSDGKFLFRGYDKPWDEWSPEEQAKFDAVMNADLEEQAKAMWIPKGIDPKDNAAQEAWIRANPDAHYLKIKQNLIDKGLPTTSFVPLGYFESLSDKTINKFLLCVATIYTFYNYPITIYYAIGLGIFSWIVAFLIRYSRILERLKHDFVPDPKSRWSEAFQRDAHERMRAYIYKKKPILKPMKKQPKKK